MLRQPITEQQLAPLRAAALRCGLPDDANAIGRRGIVGKIDDRLVILGFRFVHGEPAGFTFSVEAKKSFGAKVSFRARRGSTDHSGFFSKDHRFNRAVVAKGPGEHVAEVLDPKVRNAVLELFGTAPCESLSVEAARIRARASLELRDSPDVLGAIIEGMIAVAQSWERKPAAKRAGPKAGIPVPGVGVDEPRPAHSLPSMPAGPAKPAKKAKDPLHQTLTRFEPEDFAALRAAIVAAKTKTDDLPPPPPDISMTFLPAEDLPPEPPPPEPLPEHAMLDLAFLDVSSRFELPPEPAPMPEVSTRFMPVVDDLVVLEPSRDLGYAPLTNEEHCANLHSKDRTLVMAAVVHFGTNAFKHANAILTALARSAADHELDAFARALGNTGEAIVEHVLLELLEDSPPAHHPEILRALAKVGTKHAARRLVELRMKSPDALAANDAIKSRQSR